MWYVQNFIAVISEFLFLSKFLIIWNKLLRLLCGCYHHKQLLNMMYPYRMMSWIGLCSVLRPRQHSIGYMGDGFYRSKDPTNSIKVLKENLQRKSEMMSGKERVRVCCTGDVDLQTCHWQGTRRPESRDDSTESSYLLMTNI